MNLSNQINFNKENETNILTPFTPLNHFKDVQKIKSTKTRYQFASNVI